MSRDDARQNREARVRVGALFDGVFVDVATAALASIQSGSELTGAPGQPVDTGNLKNSWQLTFPTPNSAVIGTNVEYAPAIEDGIGPHGRMTVRSQVGGFHSVALTVTGMDRLVDDATQRRAGGAQ